MPEPSSLLVKDPYAALKIPVYRRYIGATFLFTMSLLIQEVALGYELYRITKDPLALGLVGLAEALPFIGLTLFGGHAADRKNKTGIILWSVGIITAGSIALHFVARNADTGRIPLATLIAFIYGTVFLIGLCRAFQSPAASSLRAFLIPPDKYENAATWSSSTWQTAAIVGPTVGGFLYAWVGFSNTLLVVAGIFTVSLLLFSGVRGRQEPVLAAERDIRESIREGLGFVWRTKPILYAISLDLFSVLFGGVVALLPIYAQDILKVGPEGLGILRAAPSVGAVITLIAMSHISPMVHAWRNLLIAVIGFGVFILIFAISPWMTLSVIALALSGAFDSISVVIRQTLLQVLTPDEMRGRVMAVNGIFISSSNELGSFESGLAAKLLGVIPSAIFGGVMTLCIAGWVSMKTRELMSFDFYKNKS
jgi:MFS family permease